MTVVVAFSADPAGRAALEAGITEAARDAERLIVLNVTRGDSIVDERYAHEDEVRAIGERLTSLPFPAEVRQSMSPDVSDEILHVVEAVEARLVVVGIRRRTPVGKLIMGSVAQQLILKAPCAVLSVRPAPG
jgi:nucleotide-binding universal stress UspA family protein